jgi:hypothetical protein
LFGPPSNPETGTLVGMSTTGLPFNGDIQAAQRVGDREAIRTIFTQRRNYPTKCCPPNAGGEARSPASINTANPIFNRIVVRHTRLFFDAHELSAVSALDHAAHASRGGVEEEALWRDLLCRYWHAVLGKLSENEQACSSGCFSSEPYQSEPTWRASASRFLPLYWAPDLLIFLRTLTVTTITKSALTISDSAAPHGDSRLSAGETSGSFSLSQLREGGVLSIEEYTEQHDAALSGVEPAYRGLCQPGCLTRTRVGDVVGWLHRTHGTPPDVQVLQTMRSMHHWDAPLLLYLARRGLCTDGVLRDGTGVVTGLMLHLNLRNSGISKTHRRLMPLQMQKFGYNFAHLQ